MSVCIVFKCVIMATETQKPNHSISKIFSFEVFESGLVMAKKKKYTILKCNHEAMGQENFKTLHQHKLYYRKKKYYFKEKH